MLSRRYPSVGDFPMYQEILNFFNQIVSPRSNDPIAKIGLLPLNGSSWLPPVRVCPGPGLAFTGDPASPTSTPHPSPMCVGCRLTRGHTSPSRGLSSPTNLLAII